MSDILDYFMMHDVIFDVIISSYPIKMSKCQNSNIKISFPSQKHSPICTLKPTQSFYWDFRPFIGDFGTILVRFGGSWRHKRVKILEFWIFGFIIGFPSPKTLPMLIFRSKQSFYRDFWYFRWFSGHFGLFWGSVTSRKWSRF